MNCSQSSKQASSSKVSAFVDGDFSLFLFFPFWKIPTSFFFFSYGRYFLLRRECGACYFLLWQRYPFFGEPLFQSTTTLTDNILLFFSLYSSLFEISLYLLYPIQFQFQRKKKPNINFPSQIICISVCFLSFPRSSVFIPPHISVS
jgi:hypothetical protein